MGQRTEILDVDRLGLSSGEGRRFELDVPVGGFDFGGQRYELPDEVVEALLNVDHTTAGYSLRLRFDAELSGPCMRCLEDAGHVLHVDAREVDQPGGGEDLRSPYLSEGMLDLAAWARDALVLALPTQIVCREDCRGLCPLCGAEPQRRARPRARARAGPRWAALRELKLD